MSASVTTAFQSRLLSFGRGFPFGMGKTHTSDFPWLKPTSPECVSDFEQRKSGTVPARPPSIPFKGGEFPNTPTCGMTMMMGRANGGSTVLMGGMDLTSLVRQVSGEVSTPVVDKTGLSGLFDITLDFMSERQIAGRAPGLDPNGTDTPPPLLAAALQQQLGIKLEKQVGPMAVVVVDAAERPTPD